MTIAPMKSVTIVGHAGLREEILAVLHKLGVLELTASDGVIGNGDDTALVTGLRDRLRQQSHDRAAATERRLTEVGSCLSYINRFSPIQKSLVESFLGARETVDAATWQKAGEYDYAPLLALTQKEEARLAEIRAREAELETRISELSPLTRLPLDLATLEGTTRVNVFLGQSTTQRVQSLESAVRALPQPTHFERLGAIGRQEFFLLFHFRGDTAVTDLIRTTGVEPASAPAADSTAEAAISQCNAQLTALAAEREAIGARGRDLVSERLMLWAVYDRLLLQKQREEAGALLVGTAKTFVLQGWCPADRISLVERALAPYEETTATEVRDPLPEEQPPVRLENRSLASPFEIVTNIYGWPSYSELDPTPVLAPFFWIFFGIALGDAGYGLVMVAYCLAMMRKKSTPASSHKFFRLMIYGGYSTIIFGALTGSWFGNALDYLPPALDFVIRAKNAIVLFDPIESPMVLMILSLALGLIHIMTGVAVKGYRTIKDGNLRDALMDQGLWLLLLGSLGLMAAGSALGPSVAQVSQYVAIGAAAGLVLTQGRAARNIIAKLFSGLYSLYGLIGYVSDILSYTRLMALGLATGALGVAINQIAMLLRPIPFVGIFLMLLVMAGVHLISMLINVFGSFIHSGRLQFVEFFTKFFEGGGKPFRPFAERPRYTEVPPD